MSQDYERALLALANECSRFDDSDDEMENTENDERRMTQSSTEKSLQTDALQHPPRKPALDDQIAAMEKRKAVQAEETEQVEQKIQSFKKFEAQKLSLKRYIAGRFESTKNSRTSFKTSSFIYDQTVLQEVYVRVHQMSDFLRVCKEDLQNELQRPSRSSTIE